MSGCPVFFIQNSDFFKPLQGDEVYIRWNELDGCDGLYQLIARIKSPKPIIVESVNLKKTWKEFVDYHLVIEAAGGLVFNEANACLFIFRRGYWDIPKGKIEKGESKESAALREVQEECGFKSVRIQRFLSTTYHTYSTKKHRILKPTHWYLMFSSDKLEHLTPQEAEGIVELRWVQSNETEEIFARTYPMIPELYQLAQSFQTLIR